MRGETTRNEEHFKSGTEAYLDISKHTKKPKVTIALFLDNFELLI